MIGRETSLLLAAGSCVEVTRNGFTHLATILPLHFPTCHHMVIEFYHYFSRLAYYLFILKMEVER
jgi:hypothetical protein